ncbi:hypothetical protein MUK42_31662 [Musa troglodytarum]|uniref:DUF7653 domain-containing protein n=1 Tax=Musa troglodytarum TaxID=320322 RepID=A0A9E7JVT1_9LILI|nr:hypothetical protein MUK42_31662 [Musa troglodytarum]
MPARAPLRLSAAVNSSLYVTFVFVFSLPFEAVFPLSIPPKESETLRNEVNLCLDYVEPHNCSRMRKFFSFRSVESSSPNGNSLHPGHSSSDDLVCCEKLGDSHSNFSVGEKVHDNSQTVKDSTLSPQYPENEDSSHLLLRRSFSLSSCAMNGGDFRDGNLISSSDLSRPASSSGNSPHRASSFRMHCHPLTQERSTRPRSSEQPPSQHFHAVQKYSSLKSLRECEIPSNSPNSSPVASRCNVVHLSCFPKGNGLLDQYIDAEDQEVKPETHSEKCLSESGINCSLAENQAYPSVGSPQQFWSVALSSPMCRKENSKTLSVREEIDLSHHPSARNWTRDDYETVSSSRCIQKSINKSSHPFHGRLSMNSRDYDSESTTTFEDIYMDSFEMQPTLHSDDTVQHFSIDDHSSYKNLIGHFTQDLLGLEKYDCFLENGAMSTRNGKAKSSGLQDTDEVLHKKLKEVDRMIELLPDDDFDLEELQSGDLNMPSLFQTIENIKEVRKFLVLELSAQINARLAERHAAKGYLRRARIDLKTQTRRLEQEKNELQFILEKELDRRSSSWSMKFEKMQLEEQWLRERVRELAEQNMSFQREISSLKGIKGDSQTRVVNSEIELTNLTATLEQLGIENYNLQKGFSELQEHFNATEKDRDCIRRCLREKERENKELQKLVVRLQRTINEQEKTINGLRKGFSDETENKATDGSGQLRMLQMEQLRLTGLEQKLRKELETFKHGVETLRHENIGLLTRLRAAGDGRQFSSIKLDEELRARLDCLQTEGLSLLTDISHFSSNLLGCLRHKQYEHGQEDENNTNGCSFIDYIIKSQSFSRRYENFRTSLQTIATILDEKSDLQATECQSLSKEFGMSRQSEDELEAKLKAEIILTRLLREKLHSNELEFEQLEADLASSVRVHDVMQTEIQRMQDEVSCLTHKTMDMELKMLQKDESIKQLENEYQECTKELTAARNICLKITEERNLMWEEVKSSKEKIMLLNYEVLSLKKKIEELEEDILTKEGQIAILRDSLEKPFDILCA